MEPVGKCFVVAVDVSTSQTSVVPGTSVSTAAAAAAITMVSLYQSQMMALFVGYYHFSCIFKQGSGCPIFRESPGGHMVRHTSDTFNGPLENCFLSMCWSVGPNSGVLCEY